MDQHQDWGNHIMWMDWEKRRLTGWTNPHPCVGDELRVPMQSGQIGRFKFLTVEAPGDPSDMWFSTVEDVGYADVRITELQHAAIRREFPPDYAELIINNREPANWSKADQTRLNGVMMDAMREYCEKYPQPANA